MANFICPGCPDGWCPGCEPEDFSCGSNYCDDPECVSNQPDHPDHFPHPEVL